MLLHLALLHTTAALPLQDALRPEKSLLVVTLDKGREEIRRIPRVPFLLFRRQQLDAIAESWSVTSDVGATVEDEEG